MAPIPRQPPADPSPGSGPRAPRAPALATAPAELEGGFVVESGRAAGMGTTAEPVAAEGLVQALTAGHGPGCGFGFGSGPGSVRASEAGGRFGPAAAVRPGVPLGLAVAGAAGLASLPGPAAGPAEGLAETVASLPSPAAEPRLKVIVFDDDPTGSQTVHSAPLLLRWDAPTLAAGLRHPSPLLFLLANTRALDPEAARQVVRGICRALVPALEEARQAGVIDRWMVVSRGDSTLRGHFPLEVEVIDQELGPFEATFLAPAFLEGGRTTVAGVHLLQGEPVHHSAFAQDSLFGYGTSQLATWAEVKSAGSIVATKVQHIALQELDPAPETQRALMRRLATLAGNPLVVVDAERPAHLAAFGAAVRQLLAGGQEPPRRFLFHSAASLLNGLVDLPPQPRDARALASLCRRGLDGERRPGLVLVGSHVPLADAQLASLLAEPGCGGVEVPVARVHRVLEGPLPDRLLASLEQEWLERLRDQLAASRTPVLYSSRGELACRHAAERRALGQALAGAMARVAARLAPELGYLISKGGITSHTLLAEGLGLDWVELQGQLMPGLSLVLVPPAGSSGAESAPVEGIKALPLVTVPGNLGDPDTLVRLRRWLEGGG